MKEGTVECGDGAIGGRRGRVRERDALIRESQRILIIIRPSSSFSRLRFRIDDVSLRDGRKPLTEIKVLILLFENDQEQ